MEEGREFFIVIPEFETQEQANTYFNQTNIKFAYSINNIIYSVSDTVIEVANSIKFPINEISISLSDGLEHPGTLMVKDNMLQYFKEIES